MDTEAILVLYDQAQRIDIDYPDTRKERRPHLIRYVNERGGPHFILYSHLDGADIEAVIAEEQAYFEPLGEVEWKVYGHDRPLDLRQRLAAHGFEVEDPEAVMVLDLQQTPRIPAAVPDNVTVRRLEQAAQLQDVLRIEETVWQEDMGWLTKNLGADMAIPGYLSVYVAYADEQPASAGWIYFHANGQFCDLWGGSTLAEHRGKGLYTAVLAERVSEAADRGYRFMTIDAGPMSRPIVARQGFQLLTMAWPCKWGTAS